MAEYDLSYVLVYDGSFNNLQTQVTIVNGIRTGVVYSFVATAVNYNGEGIQTVTPLIVYACGNPS
jgi:hypothetical protein